jgi:hypothetical protein
MTTDNSTYEVELSLGSLVYLSALIGLSGGTVLGIVAFLYSVVAEGEWLSGAGALLVSPLAAALSTVLYALAGFPLYRRLSRRTPSARELRGTFVSARSTNE